MLMFVTRGHYLVQLERALVSLCSRGKKITYFNDDYNLIGKTFKKMNKANINTAHINVSRLKEEKHSLCSYFHILALKVLCFLLNIVPLVATFNTLCCNSNRFSQ